MDYSEKLSNQIKKKYQQLLKEPELSNCLGDVRRCTVPIMSRYVEDYIALLIDEVNGGKYNIYIDVPLSVEPPSLVKNIKGELLKNPVKRADIIVYSNEGCKKVIKLILEIKSQLGYCRNYTTSENGKKDYDLRMEALDEAEKIKYNREKIVFELEKNYKSGIVVLMNNNISDKEFEDFIENDNYFCLYDAKENKTNKDLWYDTISSINAYESNPKHGFNAFIDFIRL